MAFTELLSSEEILRGCCVRSREGVVDEVTWAFGHASVRC